MIPLWMMQRAITRHGSRKRCTWGRLALGGKKRYCDIMKLVEEEENNISSVRKQRSGVFAAIKVLAVAHLLGSKRMLKVHDGMRPNEVGSVW